MADRSLEDETQSFGEEPEQVSIELGQRRRRRAPVGVQQADDLAAGDQRRRYVVPRARQGLELRMHPGVALRVGDEDRGVPADHCALRPVPVHPARCGLADAHHGVGQRRIAGDEGGPGDPARPAQARQHDPVEAETVHG